MKISFLILMFFGLGLTLWAHEDIADHDHEHAEHNHKHESHTHVDHDHKHEEHAEHKHEHEEHAHAHTDADGHDHGAPVELHVDEKSRVILNMQIETVPESAAALSDSVYGRLTAPQHETETYALAVGGRISLQVKTAQSVKQGDVLYKVQSPAVAEQIASIVTLKSNRERCEAEIASMMARIERLQQAEARNSELETQHQFKKAELKQLDREIESAEARLRILCMGAELVRENDLPTLVVRAGSDGTVRNVGITQGSWGEQGSAVLTLSKPQALEIEALIYGSDVPAVSEVRALVPSGREMVPVKGTWRLSEQVNPETQTRTLYFTPESLPEGARAGQLCRLDLYNGPANEYVVNIPDSAVVRVGTDDVVFVEQSKGKYFMYKVHAGASRRGMTPVEGLEPGQRIVVKGGYELKFKLPTEGAPKKAAGHFHADGKFHEGEDH